MKNEIHMDVINYFEPLTNEINALKNRVRNLLGNGHHLTDGEWKEAVLRTIMRRHIPVSIEIGRGFIVKSGCSSHQIDILFFDRNKPTLFRDRDLLFITPDATKGIFEVKTRIDDIQNFERILMKLAEDISFIRESIKGGESDNIFCGLFVYETRFNENQAIEILNIVKKISDNNQLKIINHICLGDLFIKYWQYSPENTKENYNKWHLYKLKNLAAGYFLSNIIATYAQLSLNDYRKVWFPLESKERYKLGEIEF